MKCCGNGPQKSKDWGQTPCHSVGQLGNLGDLYSLISEIKDTLPLSLVYNGDYIGSGRRKIPVPQWILGKCSLFQTLDKQEMAQIIV